MLQQLIAQQDLLPALQEIVLQMQQHDWQFLKQRLHLLVVQMLGLAVLNKQLFLR
jgi:hypothetical protein